MLGTKAFQAETKRLLEIVINSIYTNKEIFLRELISNASDAIDKLYYKSLTDDSMNFNREDYYIKITVDKDSRTLKVSDTGIGMTRQELETSKETSHFKRAKSVRATGPWCYCLPLNFFS